MPFQRLIFFQPRTQAISNYANGAGKEQTWAPWFAPFLAPSVIRMGLQVELVDARTDPSWEEKLSQLGPADLLAASVMTGAAIRDAVRASFIAQSLGAYVVWGGPHPTLFPGQTLEQAPVDAIVTGFGNKGLTGLLASLLGGDLTLADAVGFRVKAVQLGVGKRQLERLAPLKPRTIDASDSMPYLDLIKDWAPYLNADEAIASRTTNYVTSEGCRRRCTFCSEPQTSSGAWYRRDIDTSVESLASLIDKSGATGLKLHDPNFFDDVSRALYFAESFSARTGLPWAASLHPADLIAMTDDELASAAEGGLCRVLIGLESPVPELIKIAGKKYDPTQISRMAARLAAHGIRGMFTFIVGWPGAAASHYQETIDAAFGIRDVWESHQCKIHFLEPWPGTPLFRLLEKQGFEYPSTLESWSNIDYYAAQYRSLHDPAYESLLRAANVQLSPYVNA